MSGTQPHLSHPKYRPDIDGLRAVAVLAVVAFHAFPNWMKGGFIGVDVFFVISGYLISTILFENLDKGTFSFAEFYSRRIRRIFPALMVILAACFAFGWFVLFADEYKQLGKYIAAGAGFVSNLFLWSDAGYFDNSAEMKPLLHLWSLGIEEQFYIIWPVLLWFAWKRKFNLLTITVLVAFVSFFLNIKGYKQDAVATFYLPQTRFWELLSGSLLAWFNLYKKNAYQSTKLKVDSWLVAVLYREKNETDGAALANAISIFGFMLLAYGFWRITKDSAFPGGWALVPVVGSVLIIAAGPKAFLNRHILSRKIAVWFGLISFPLYLWHWPLLSFARIVEGGTPNREIRIGLVFLSIMLSWATYKLIERPLRLGGRNGLKTLLLVLAMIIVGYVGFNTFERNGLAFRSIAKSGTEISQAKSDWRYESTKLINGEIVNAHHFKGQKSDTVLFIGSSHMGQYFPRLAMLYASSKPMLSSLYASRNHCAPIPDFDVVSAPENIHCQEYYAAALLLAQDDSVKKVVFSANWPHFYVDGKLTEQALKFSRDLEILAKHGKKIYLISNPPIDPRLEPYSRAKPLRLGLMPSLGDLFINRESLENKVALSEILKFASKNSIQVIDPFDYLCQSEKCPVILSGKPLYNDQGHIRAQYAESSATFIDNLLNQ